MDYREIVAWEHDPRQLERMYRKDREGFAAALPNALDDRPNSPVLMAWAERLRATEKEPIQEPRDGGPQASEDDGSRAAPKRSDLNLRELWPILLVSLFLGFIFVMALPSIGQLRDGQVPDMTVFSFLAFLPAAAACGFLLHWRGWPRQRMLLVGTVLSLVLLVKFNLLSGVDAKTRELANHHLALLAFLAICWSYVPGHWLGMEGWKRFVRFYGEFTAYAMLLLMGLLFFVLMGVCLLGMWEIHPTPFVLIVLQAFLAIPLAAYWLAFRLEGSRLMPITAMVLTPPMAALLAYFLMAEFSQTLAFKVRAMPILPPLLYLVAALFTLFLAVYSVIGLNGRRRRFGEYSLTAMLVLAVVGGLPMLAEMLAVFLGEAHNYKNLMLFGLFLVVYGHLLALATALVLKLLGRMDMDRVEAVTVQWIPVYVGWCLFMGVIAPWLL